VSRADTAWIVVGKTGEYSDRTEWPVRVFDTEAAAIDFRDRLLDVYRRLTAEHGDGYGERELVEHAMREIDPGLARIDYTGLDYTIWKAPLGRAATKPRRRSS
jgi:hypothetical protein